METLNCPEEMKVSQAAMYLKEDADKWWKDEGPAIMAKPGFGWKAFTETLEKKYYPMFLKKEKAQEFINLKMGNMSVTDNKFLTLSRFAPEVVATEELKAQRFEQGLTMELQMRLAGEAFSELDTVYGRAAHLYGLQVKDSKKENAVGEKRKDFGGNANQNNFNKKQKGGNFQGNGFQGKGNRNFSRGNSKSTHGKAERIHFCRKCPRNHPGEDCEGNTVTCRKCDKKGHYEYECWSGKKKDYGSGGNNGKNGQSSNQNGKQSGQQGNNGNGNSNFQNKGANAGKLSVMGKKEAKKKSAEVVTGTFSIHSTSVKVLFDSGATHSFISASVVGRLGLVDHEKVDLPISLPNGKVVRCSKLFKGLVPDSDIHSNYTYCQSEGSSQGIG